MENISMIPYKKQLDINIQISIYENIYIITFNFPSWKFAIPLTVQGFNVPSGP